MRLSLAALLVLAACSGSGTTTTGARATAPLEPTVRDSAGVELAEHPADAFARAPLITIDTVPLFEFGGEDAEIEMSRAGNPRVLRDGRLAIVAEGTIHIIDTSGAVVERIGRSGTGPGEFRSVYLTYARGDTLVAEDAMNARVSFVVPGAGIVRERAVRGFAQGVMQVAAGALGGDTLVVQTAGYRPPAEVTAPIALPWFASRLDPGVDVSVAVDSLPGMVLVPTADGARPRMYDGTPSVAVMRDVVVTTSGRTWSLRVLRPDGALVRIIRVSMPRRVLDPAMASVDVDSQLAQFREARLTSDGHGGPVTVPDTSRIAASLRRHPKADSISAIGSVSRTPDELLWVRDGGYDYADTTWGFTAVRQDGTILGRLVGSGPRRIAAFGPGVVVLRTVDDDGFVTFRVHRLNGLR